MCVHVPLANVNIGFSFLTALMSWLLDKDSKFKVFLVMRFVSGLLYEPSKTIEQWRRSSKVQSTVLGMSGSDLMDKDELSYDRLSKGDKKKFKDIVDWSCLATFMYLAIAFHLFYRIFLPDVLVVASNSLISLADYFKINMLFMRFVHLTFFGQDTSAL